MEILSFERGGKGLRERNGEIAESRRGKTGGRKKIFGGGYAGA
jgi:hypothetical protein